MLDQSGADAMRCLDILLFEGFDGDEGVSFNLIVISTLRLERQA